MDRIFGLPYCEMDIDIDKISIEYEIEKRSSAYLQTSYNKENVASEESLLYILEKIKDFTEQFVNAPYTLELKNIWATEYDYKDFLEPHIHGNSDLSFVIFRKMQERNRLTFFSPAYELIQTRDFWLHEKVYAERSFDCGAKQGQMVIFPSFVRHMVYPSQVNEKRITYSGNVSIGIME